MNDQPMNNGNVGAGGADTQTRPSMYLDAREAQAVLELLAPQAGDRALLWSHPQLQMKLRQLTHEGAPSRVLDLRIDARRIGWLCDVDNVWAFQYDPQWLELDGSFVVAPPFTLQKEAFVDGSSERPIQWHFDNLLPEELLRQVLAKESGIDEGNAFFMLRHYGAESAGSLSLLPVGQALVQGGYRRLENSELSRRISMLGRASLSKDAPKRMSLAGAQHKLVVALVDGQLHEPLASGVSTHILKPESVNPDYPATVINEFFVMTLARRMGLPVPLVHRLYVPEPVYVIERFDRKVMQLDPQAGEFFVTRQHALDACQVLGRPASLKYAGADLESLVRVVEQCRSPAKARTVLFDWLVFNALVGNGDNHLKNISFLATERGIEVAPFYDLLSTGVYEAGHDGGNRWPSLTELAFKLPNARYFGDVTRDVLLSAGRELGVPASVAKRRLDALAGAIAEQSLALMAQVESQYEACGLSGAQLGVTRNRELHLLRQVHYVVIQEMASRLHSKN